MNSNNFEKVYIPSNTPPLQYNNVRSYTTNTPFIFNNQNNNLQMNNYSNLNSNQENIIYNNNQTSVVDYIYQNIDESNVIKNYLAKFITSKEIINQLLRYIKPIEVELLFNTNYIQQFTVDQKIFVNKFMEITQLNNLINVLKFDNDIEINNYINLINFISYKINEKYINKNNLNNIDLLKLYFKLYLKNLSDDEINRQVFYLIM
tara:strand:+ start:375 stop:989 length:615 start_codon:yes stop_codon:yes gene_type:complete